MLDSEDMCRALARQVWRWLLLALVVCRPAIAAEPPWAVWDDLRRLAELTAGDQVLLHGSHCLDGCRFDRHSADDWRYLRLDGDEGVIFEQPGAGAITRIWMTQGEGGLSHPLRDTMRLRIYVDGASRPVVDVPLPALFDGSTAPFLPPLVGDQALSSGGNFSYVPIAYRNGCRVTLEGAHEEKIWFQLTYHRLATPDGVESFTGTEDLSAWSALLGNAGEDPWPVAGGLGADPETLAGELVLQPGDTADIVSFAAADVLTALRLTLPAAAWSAIELRLTFDSEERARLPLADFFAAGREGAGTTRSALIGTDAEGTLYSYFPMPFLRNATITLHHLDTLGAPTSIAWQVRRMGEAPALEAGLFGARLHADPQTEIGVDIPLLALDGSGKWVGLFADLGSVDSATRQYLEGDERLYIDGSPHPAHYGTGTEDLFNGGFYFEQGTPFGLALHGSPYHLEPDGEDVTAAYRLMLSDAVTFTHDLSAGLEGGPIGDLALRVRTVAWFYHQRRPRLWRHDVLAVGDADSRMAHAYSVAGAHDYQQLTALFEGEPPLAATASGVYRPPGSASFRLRATTDGATRLRLRRRLDAAFYGQAAEVWVDGLLAGIFPAVAANSDRRWAELDLDLPPAVAPAAREIDVEVIALANPGTTKPDETTFTAFRYELWANVPPLLFADGFESGDTSEWSTIP